MRIPERVCRRALLTAAALLVATLWAACCRLAAAEPPKKPTIWDATGGAAPQYISKITLSIARKDQAKEAIVLTPAVIPTGRVDYAEEVDRHWRVEVNIETDQTQNPLEHTFRVVVARLGGEQPFSYLFPRVSFADRQDCTVKTVGQNGDQCEISMSLGPYKSAN